MASIPPTCVVTGATGYVGGRIADYLRTSGWHVSEWSRRAGPGGTTFRLGQEVDPKAFTGASALVHCAYDFSARGWAEIAAINVRGSEELFQSAQAAGVGRMVFISSAS